MRYAIISDVHANAYALKRVLECARSEGVERVVCLGDVVGYGQLPKQSIRLLKECHAEVIAGNHDDAVSGRISAKDFAKLAANAVKRHKAELDAEDIRWLRELKHTLILPGGAVCAHGDMTDPEKFYYIEDERDALANFKAFKGNLLFVGHTHSPSVFVTGASGNVYKLPPQDFTIEEGKRYIVNPGSVGYPRDVETNCVSSFVIYDSMEGTVSYKTTPFVVASVMQQGFTAATWWERLSFPLAILAFFALFATVVLVFSSMPRHSDESTAAPEAIQEKSVPLRMATLEVKKAQKTLRANLVLDKYSSSALMRITFYAANGKKISHKDVHVKKSSKKSFKIPQKTAKINLSVYPAHASTPPVIASLEPTIE